MDLRSQYVVSLQSLPRQEGSMTTFKTVLDVPADVRLELIGIPEGAPMDVDLTLQSVSEGVFVQGRVKADAEGQCSRCLIDLEVPMDEQVAELIFYPERREALKDEGDDEADELPVIEDDHIDLEPILRDALVLAMPFRPLCEPDCQGLCPDCGERWADLPEDHFHEVLDPRFNALDGLAAKLAAEESGEAGVADA